MPRFIITYLRVAGRASCAHSGQGQVSVEKVMRFLAPTLARETHHVDQHFREGVAGHRAINSALHFEVKEQAAVAG